MDFKIIILLCLAASGINSQLISADCWFWFNGGVYSCTLSSILYQNETIIQKIGGIHRGERNDDNLMRMDFMHADISRFPKMVFQQFKNLQNLYVWSSTVSVLEPLQNCESLRLLLISSVEMGKLVEDMLYACENLETFEISFSWDPIELPPKLFNFSKNLKTLTLNNNFLKELHEDLFRNLYNLEQLKLYSNEIETLPETIFNDLKNLKTLRLDSNKFMELHPNLFLSQFKLELLVISENNLISLKKETFNPLGSLQTLHLYENPLENIEPHCFQKLRFLKDLYITDTKLKNFPGEHLEDLFNLQEFAFSNNSEIQLDAYFFERVSKLVFLRKLDLSQNQISFVDIAANKSSDLFWVQGFPFLEKLNLAGNRIKNVGVGMFKKLKSLKDLSLESNEIFELPKGAFEGQENLQILNLGGNQIEIVKSIYFEDLIKLESLRLDVNFIDTIEDSAFYQLPHLELLDLGTNRIRFIRSNIFSRNTELEVLDISHNEIVSIVPTAFDGLVDLKFLHLRQNLCIDQFIYIPNIGWDEAKEMLKKCFGRSRS